MPTERRRRKEDQGISPFMDPAFRRSSVYFDDIEYQRKFEQNLIRYDLKSGTQIREEITNTVVLSGGGGGGGGAGCYWTKEGSNLVYYEGNVGVGVHPHDNDFEVRGNVLVEAKAEQPYVEIRNWSDTAYDPVLKWSLGATPACMFAMGVDDSDANKLKIANQATLGASYSTELEFGTILYYMNGNDDKIDQVLLTDFDTGANTIAGGPGTGDGQFDNPFGIAFDGTYLYVADSNNYRIQKFLASTGAFVSKYVTTGSGYKPYGVCWWAGVLYVTIYSSIANSAIYLIDAETMTKISEFGTQGTGDTNFSAPKGITTDGTYLYICDSSNDRIKKHTMTGTYVNQIGSAGTGNGQFNNPVYIATEGTNLLVCDYSNKRVQKFLASSLAYVSKVGMPVRQVSAGNPTSVTVNGTYYYVCVNDTVPLNGYVLKYDIATDTLQDTYDPNSISPGRPGPMWGSIILKYRVLIGDLIILHQTGEYLEIYPKTKFMDDVRFYEGADPAGKYVGLRAPSTVTADYSLTLPAAVASAQGHLYGTVAGVLNWGQDVNSAASPTFVRLTLSQAIGTAPMTITSTTVVTNFNADQVDGKHEAAFVLIDGTRALTASWDVGSFEVRAQTFQSDIATGTAPFTVASTTAVTNLNADLLDGSHAAAFAAAAHNHSGVYEPVLGNPGTDGWVLSSTILGVRSWIAPGGGAAAFLDLTDVTEADYVGHALQFVRVNAAENGLEFTASSVAAHDILSASHGDALASAVSRGSIIYGNSTPKWAELPVGNAGDVLTTDGTDVAWAAPGGASHAMLSATHTDTLADTVIRGDILYGNATPKWARLAKGTSGHILTMGADEPSWSAPAEPGMFTLINESVDGLSTAALHGQGTYTYFGAWASTLVGTSTIAVVAHPVSGKMIQVTGDTVTEGSSYSAIVTTFQVGLGSGTRIRWKMRTSDVTVGTKGCAVGTAFGSEVAQVYFRATGSKITFWNGTTNTDLMTAVNNTWYQIDMIIIQGTTACYAYVFIDGVQQGAPKVCATVTVVVDTFWVYCNTTGTAAAVNLDVDDIQIGTNWFWNLVE